MHIFLLGFMGAGKSHDGRRLAELLDLPFHDLDTQIEAAAGKSIKDIFADDGEEYFRQLEKQVLLATADLSPAIIATGGGAPCFHDNMDWMNENGITVFLDPPLSVLVKRLEAGRAHRPLLHKAEELASFVSAKLSARRSFYEKARIHVRPTDDTPDVTRLLQEQLAAALFQ